MKYGQLVRMTTEVLGGGRPQIVVFAVAEESPEEAISIVRKGAGVLDEKLDIVGPIRWDILTDQFGLQAGEFAHL